MRTYIRSFLIIALTALFLLSAFGCVSEDGEGGGALPDISMEDGASDVLENGSDIYPDSSASDNLAEETGDVTDPEEPSDATDAATEPDEPQPDVTTIPDITTVPDVTTAPEVTTEPETTTRPEVPIGPEPGDYISQGGTVGVKMTEVFKIGFFFTSPSSPTLFSASIGV